MPKAIASIFAAALILAGCGASGSSSAIPASNRTNAESPSVIEAEPAPVGSESAMPHEIVSEEGPAEVLINPSTENLPVTEPDAGNLIIVEPAPTRIPTADEKQGILSAVSDMIDQYKAVNGVFPWYSWNASVFPPYPPDADYPNLATATFEITEDYNFLDQFDVEKYTVSFTAMNSRDDWSIESIQIIEKATGKEITPATPPYTDDERIDFDDYLQENLNKSWYAYYTIATTGVEPVIGYIDSYKVKINNVIAQYQGTVVKTKRIECPYSRAQLEACLSEIESLPIIKNSRANQERKISGIVIRYDKVEVLLLEPMPDLVEILTEKYPANMVTIKIDAGPNPDT